MNLYQVTMTHYAPRGSDSATHGFVYAADDDGVFEALLGTISFEPEEIREQWADDELDDDEDPVQNRRDQIIAERTDFDDSWTDWYYGHTAYSWELVAENVDGSRRDVLAGLGLVIS